MADDGFSVKYDENWTLFSQRLAVLGENIAKRITVSALRESALFMKREAILYVSVSERSHKLLVDKNYIELYPTNMKKHIRYGRIRQKYLEDGEVGYRVYVAIKVAWYAKFLEFGRSNMAPKPFMRPTFEHNYQNVARLFIEMVDTAILDGGFR